MTAEVTNVLIAGLGGQGVLKASDILAEAAFLSGRDVKKAEIHGMSQRGGSVTSDVRFAAPGGQVLSPMIPSGQADFLVVLAEDQVEVNLPMLRAGGTLIAPHLIDVGQLPHPRALNTALLGMLCTYLDLGMEHWLAGIRANLPEKVFEVNRRAFEMGMAARVANDE